MSGAAEEIQTTEPEGNKKDSRTDGVRESQRVEKLVFTALIRLPCAKGAGTA